MDSRGITKEKTCCSSGSNIGKRNLPNTCPNHRSEIFAKKKSRWRGTILSAHMPASPSRQKGPGFQGFSPKTFDFLKGLKTHNTKVWFEEHRPEYEEFLLHPFENLVRDLTPHMVELDPAFEILPLKKMISRINRDIRFSKDKSPYRPNMWLSFKRPTTDWKLDPVYFFEILSEDTYRYGMGFYSPSKNTMNALRWVIDEAPEEVRQFNILFTPNSCFELTGTRYKRPLKSPTAVPPDLVPWYQLKDIVVMCTRPVEDILFQGDLVEEIRKAFTLLKPLYYFFWEMRNAGEKTAD